MDGFVVFIGAYAMFHFMFVAPVTATLRAKKRTAILEERTATLRFQSLDRSLAGMEQRQRPLGSMRQVKQFMRHAPAKQVPATTEIDDEVEILPGQMLTPEVEIKSGSEDMQYYQQLSMELDDRSHFH